MELTFQSHPFPYLQCLMQETHFQEETADTIVPDSYPDIDHIADCFADVVLRGKECRIGTAMISGGIKAGILYVPETSASIQCLEVYIPFTIRFEHRELSDQSHLIASMCVRSVDARIINSRKVSLRVEIGCELSAYKHASEETFELCDVPQTIQIKKEQYHMILPLEINEKSFLIHDTIDLSGHPAVKKVCKFRCELLPAEQRLVGDKAIFKGTLLCKMLYLTDDDQLHCIQHIFTYSQFCELSTEYEEESLSITSMITGYDLSPIYEGTQNKLDFDVHVLTQCKITGIKSFDLYRDAYSTRGEFKPQWRKFRFHNLLDQHTSSHTLKIHVNGDGMEILDLDVYCDYPIETRTEDNLHIKVPVIFRLLTRINGNLQQKTERGEIFTDIPLSEHASCHGKTVPTGELYFTMTGDGADLRYGIELRTDCYCNHDLTSICGGFVENTDQAVRTPTIILRSVPADTSLWDLAKVYRTTENEIMIANRLETNHITEETLLLVPAF